LLRELIRVEGKIDLDGATDIPVKYLSLKRLTFTHGERFTIAEDDKGLQRDWEMQDKDNALVRLRGAEKTAASNAAISHTAAAAQSVSICSGNTMRFPATTSSTSAGRASSCAATGPEPKT
jgi:hypothetical protein